MTAAVVADNRSSQDLGRQQSSRDTNSAVPSEQAAIDAVAAGHELTLARDLTPLLTLAPEMARGIANQLRTVQVLQESSARQLAHVESLHHSLAAADERAPSLQRTVESLLGKRIPFTDGASLSGALEDAKAELRATLVLQNVGLKEVERRVEAFLTRHDPVTRELQPWKETLAKLQKDPIEPSMATSLLHSIQHDLGTHESSVLRRVVAETGRVSHRTIGTVADKFKDLGALLDRAISERTRAVIEICGQIDHRARPQS